MAETTYCILSFDVRYPFGWQETGIWYDYAMVSYKLPDSDEWVSALNEYDDYHISPYDELSIPCGSTVETSVYLWGTDGSGNDPNPVIEPNNFVITKNTKVVIKEKPKEMKTLNGYEIVDAQARSNIATITKSLGDIDSVLDAILAKQNTVLGGNS